MSPPIPAQCYGCQKKDVQVRECRIRVYQFQVWNKKCPREVGGFEPITETKPSQIVAEPTPQLIPLPHRAEREVYYQGVGNISVSDIETAVFSPRKYFSQDYLRKLCDSINVEDQLQPIVVRRHPTKSGKYQLIDGEHRVRAFKKLGELLIRAEILDLSDEEATVLATRLNQLHGQPLNETEEALRYKEMIDKFGYTQQKVAEKFKVSQGLVSQRLKLVEDSSPELRDAIITRVIKPTVAREIVELPKEDQTKVVKKVIEKRLPQRATVGLVHAIKAASSEQKQEILDKPLEVYASTFKDPKQLEHALLTIKPEDDFLKKSNEIKTEMQAKKFWDESKPEEAFETLQCPGCGRKLRVDWAKGEVTWD